MLSDSKIGPLLQLARLAGADIMSFYDRIEVIEKSDQSPLTQADLASHRRIVDGLSNITPRLPVLSEESNPVDVDERLNWTVFWLVDPLDGTKEFIKRNGEFTVNIALIRDHLPIFGVVYTPVSDTIYWGGEAYGSYCQIGHEAPRPLKVSALGNTPIRVVGSRSHPSPDLESYLARLGDHSFHPVGSSLKFCRIAEGSADVYPRFGPTSEWDTAAGHAVLEGAGGSVVDLDGHPLRYNSRASILNPYFIAHGDPTRSWL